MKCIFIYNPYSGKGKINKYLDIILKKLEERFGNIDVVSTKYKGHAIELASNACDNYEVICFSGGDGTFNEIVQGISGKEKKAILAYIPLGTVNDIAHNLEISKNINKALDKIISGTPTDFDVCKINDKYFMYAAAAGIFSQISYTTRQTIKKIIGKVAYFLNAGKDIINFKDFGVDIILDDKIVTGRYSLVLFLNTRYSAGFRISPKNDLHDGKMEIALVKNTFSEGGRASIFSLLNICRLFIFGVPSSKKNKNIQLFESSKIKLRTTENIIWCLDGEQGMNGNIDIEVLKDHIKIIV